jgi:5-methyltetrahydrofolate--homocysteine methyltransferase
VTTTAQDFVVIGENIHATRVLSRKSERISVDEQGAEAIVFTDEAGTTRHLAVSEEEKLTQAHEEGRIKHVRLAVRLAMGTGPESSTALSYLVALAHRQVKAGAQFLDVNLDEVSNKLAEQLQAMRFVVGVLAPLVDIPLSIDSSNLEILASGLEAASEGAGTRLGPPMLNSASLERLEALKLAARLGGPVVVTAAGDSGMPTNTEERVLNASRMVEASLQAGIGLDQIFVDPLVFPIAVDSSYGRHCLDAISQLRSRFGDEVHITGGMSNVSFGLPNRRLLNDAFLALAIEAGADSGIVDPTVVSMQRALAMDRTSRPFQLALDVLTGTDENCRAYMKAHRAGELAPPGS